MNVVGTYYGATLLDGNNLIKTNTKSKIELEYYSIEKQIYTKSKPTVFYGISIVKKEYGKENIKFEKTSVEEVSTNKNRVMNIIRLLKNYKVTPVALEDVLADLLKQNGCKTA